MATFKLQSAMEYLMTYGWAILIIAIVIGALLAVGVFSSPIGTTCVAVSGYTCQVLGYSASGGTISGVYVPAGNLLISFGQASGATWASGNIFFVNASNEAVAQQYGLNTAWPNNGFNGATVPSGVYETVVIPATSGARVGGSVNGYFWIAYQTTGASSTAVQAQVASVSAKAQ